MKVYFVIAIVAVALVASTMPVSADSTFNDMSKCIQSWGKGCGECGSAKAAAPAPVTGKKCCCKKTDTLGNKVDCCTNNSGKTRLGV